jgi:chromosome segregation ATPase
MRYRNLLAITCAASMLAGPVIARALRPVAAPQDKDYLTEAEADKIRDADTPALRIKIYIEFAEDRLKKFEYEIHRTVPERRRGEILNALLNGYSACIDDAADQIDVAKEKQLDIRDALKMLKAKDKEFLTILKKYEKDGPELDTYRDTLEDAIDGTEDALTELEDAEKEATPGPVRRKPS